MWCPSPHKVEILMLIQSRDKDLVSCATLRTTFALQATDYSVLLHLIHESIFVPICCRTYFTTLLSLPVLVPFGMVFVGWLCWKNSTGQWGHNILFEFSHTHLGLGVSEYHLGQLKAKIAKLRTQLLEPPKVPYLACITWEWLKQTCISCVSQYVLWCSLTEGY